MDTTQGAAKPAKDSVLVVDDDTIIRACLRKILQSRGYQVMEAATAGLAVAAAKRFPVKLVFLDIILPDANGLSIINDLCEAREGLKIVLISTDTTFFEHPQAKGARVVDCIGKPLSPDRVDRVLQMVFGSAPATPP